MSLRAWFLALVGAGATVAACGGSGDESSGSGVEPGSDISYLDACKDAHRALCARKTRCGAAINFDIECRDIPRSCERYMKAGAAINRTAQSWLACARAADGESCDKAVTCDVPGSKPAGTPCWLNDMCQSGACIGAMLGSGLCPQCDDRIPEGEPCGVPTAHHSVSCGRGLTCLDGRCRPRPGPGQTCGPPDCGLFCKGECLASVCIDGICKPIPVQNGSACPKVGVEVKCIDGFCHAGVCEVPTTARIGEPCGVAAECVESVCLNGVCSPRPPDGASCVTVEECPPESYCIDSKCQYFPTKCN